MKYNKSLTFWDECHRECNCGSYALNLNEWYHPGDLCGHGTEDSAGWFLADQDPYYTDDELADMLAEYYIDHLLEDFGDSISMPSLDEPEVIPNGEELIAFRAGAYRFGEDSDECDYDFHFKVYRDGDWFEKMGSDDIQRTSINDWCNSCMYYNSQTFYFTHKWSENLTNS